MENLLIAFQTDRVKDLGEKGDSFLSQDNLFIVAEGLGGEFLSEMAKDYACHVTYESFFRHLSDGDPPSAALFFALTEANEEILKEREKTGQKMAASVSVAYIEDNIMFFTHLGDSRIYALHGVELTQLTRDHTIIEEEPYMEPRLHDPRLMHALTEGLGIHKEPHINIKKFALHNKDLLVMTTEGLTKRVSNKEILRLSLKTNNLKKLSSSLIDSARKRGEDSPITVGIIRVQKRFQGPQKKVMVYSVLVLLFLLLVGSYAVKYGLKGPQDYQTEDMEAIEEKSAVSGRQKQKEPELGSKPKISPGPKPEISKPLIKSAEKQTKAQIDDEIEAFIAKWRRAWEHTAGRNGDINSYISCYSNVFVAKGLNKNRWRQDKAVKGRKKRYIRIKLTNIKISESQGDNPIEVRFLQDYRSSNYSGKSKKILLLKKEEAGWKIIAEKTV